MSEPILRTLRARSRCSAAQRHQLVKNVVWIGAHKSGSPHMPELPDFCAAAACGIRNAASSSVTSARESELTATSSRKRSTDAVWSRPGEGGHQGLRTLGRDFGLAPGKRHGIARVRAGRRRTHATAPVSRCRENLSSAYWRGPQDHCLKLLGDHGLVRVSAKPRRRLVEQHR
jgi:hypothetical protein